jgi:hypothetical protein
VKRSIPILLVLVLLLGIRTLKNRSTPRSETLSVANSPEIQITEASSGSRQPPNQSPRLIGEVILRDYANTNLPPQNDLTVMSHLMQNSLLLLKSAANRPLSANEDWADFFTGKNAAHERFFSDNHPALNAKGQLIDRWGTPLFFHALGGGRYEIRSAGPDKVMWTSDDVHRNADGSFRRGPDLNPQALFGSTNRVNGVGK